MVILAEVINIINLIKADEIVRSVALSITALSFIFAVCISPIAAAVIFSNYIFGIITCWCFIKYQKQASFYLQRFVSFYRIRLASNKFITQSCGICNNKHCSRHNISKKCLPWKKVRINKKLDSAIEHFYNRLLENFVLSWYNVYTKDSSFSNELKFSLRYASAAAALKVQNIDIGSLIANRFIPCIVKHIDDYLCMQQIANLKSVAIDKITVDYLGKRLHIAVTNRENEMCYLRQLTASLMPKLLPEENLNCNNYTTLIREIFAGWVLLPVTDVLADPNVINLFVVLGTTYKSLGGSHNDDFTETVEILHNFIKKDIYYSPLASDLKTVLKDSSLLYNFMQFLKKEGSVHILQFCLDVEEFNNKLLTPDLSKKQLENLHIEAYNIYKIYINPESPDFIGCADHIAAELSHLLEGGMYNVAKLRTSEPLFQAYDHAFGLLEKEYLPEFYHCNEFYNFLCGSKVTATYKKTAIKSRKYYENATNQGTVAKISSGLGKIKGVLQTKQPIEGYYTPEMQTIENDATHFIDDVMPHTPIWRDLTMWRISIHVKYAQHNRSHQIFYVNIERTDSVLEGDLRSWIVQRRDNDFFLLKAKLVEFHGDAEISDNLLPSKRNLYSADVENRRLKYEDFLKQLLQKPLLKSSDLLYTFLTSEQCFTDIINSSVPSVDLENIYQSVTYKLRKEKGQYLDAFMNTFLGSIGKVKQKVEWAEVGDEIEILEHINLATPKTYNNKIFDNIYGVTQRKCEDSSSSPVTPAGICESIFYLLKQTLKVRPCILKLYTAICNVFQQPFESLCKVVIERKIKSALSQSNLAFLIELLEGIVFDKHKPHQDPAERKKMAFHLLDTAFPHWLVKVLGDDFKVGVHGLLEILQNPLYNKQLVYSLLDILIAEIYPDLDLVQTQTA